MIRLRDCTHVCHHGECMIICVYLSDSIIIFSIIPMSYYGRNDIPFGEFLHRYCFREQYICQSCNVDMSAHQRHFIHGGKELRITMQQLGASIPGGDKNVFTWSTCTQCGKQVSSVHVLDMCIYFHLIQYYGLHIAVYCKNTSFLSLFYLEHTSSTSVRRFTLFFICQVPGAKVLCNQLQLL